MRILVCAPARQPTCVLLLSVSSPDDELDRQRLGHARNHRLDRLVYVTTWAHQLLDRRRMTRQRAAQERGVSASSSNLRHRPRRVQVANKRQRTML